MTLKKSLFYAAVAMLIIYGQFFMTHGLVTGTPPLLADLTIQGQQVSRQIGKGPGMIYFWADWCGVCRSMQETLNPLFEQYPTVTVAVRSGNAEEVLQYQQEQGLNWQSIADEQGLIGERYHIKGVPTLFILDKQGQIEYSAVGYTSAIGLKIKLWLAGL